MIKKVEYFLYQGSIHIQVLCPENSDLITSLLPRTMEWWTYISAVLLVKSTAEIRHKQPQRLLMVVILAVIGQLGSQTQGTELIQAILYLMIVLMTSDYKTMFLGRIGSWYLLMKVCE